MFCLQDLMFHAIHAQRTGKNSMASRLKKVSRQQRLNMHLIFLKALFAKKSLLQKELKVGKNMSLSFLIQYI